jgi:2,3-bisphosphoglycerate-independent phosphoglycerate mutase
VTAGILLILDGWGSAPPAGDNAIHLARTPTLDALQAKYPATLAGASGAAVGLPPGTVGNSEIGHMVIGAGRAIDYDSVAVQRRIDSGELRAHPLLADACRQVSAAAGRLHLIGLVSDGQIHSHLDHMAELLHAAAGHGVPVAIHAITDGRDVADGTARAYLQRLEACCAAAGTGVVASVIGRGYAMDKSGDMELTAAACAAIFDGHGTRVTHWRSAVAGHADSWIGPAVVTDAAGRPAATIRAGDAILFTNFRSDRIQQLADTLIGSAAAAVPPRGVRVLSLTEYDTAAPIPALVPRADASGGLADALEAAAVRSVRIAEAEKFEHVTFYLNGRSARRRVVEDHVRIGGAPADYRARPQMNLDRLTGRVAAAARGDAPLIVANLANIDVVGHTGDLQATCAAAGYVDAAVERICQVAAASGRWVLLTGDHGNGEQMSQARPDGDRRPYGGHTANPVPVILVPAPGQLTPPALATGATLADIAPTVLALLDCPAPHSMTGRTLL